jgi:hypothetical protein
MKALILYALFVAAGAVASALIGLFVEREVSTVISLIVFLALFFSNFVISWLAVVLVMDGSFKNLRGMNEQLAIEKAGQQYMAEHRA